MGKTKGSAGNSGRKGEDCVPLWALVLMALITYFLLFFNTTVMNSNPIYICAGFVWATRLERSNSVAEQSKQLLYCALSVPLAVASDCLRPFDLLVSRVQCSDKPT